MQNNTRMGSKYQTIAQFKEISYLAAILDAIFGMVIMGH